MHDRSLTWFVSCLGWIYDSTGSYNAGFCLAGGLSSAAGLLMFVDFHFRRKEKRAIRVVRKPQDTVTVVSYETSV